MIDKVFSARIIGTNRSDETLSSWTMILIISSRRAPEYICIMHNIHMVERVPFPPPPPSVHADFFLPLRYVRWIIVYAFINAQASRTPLYILFPQLSALETAYRRLVCFRLFGNILLIRCNGGKKRTFRINTAIYIHTHTHKWNRWLVVINCI